MANPLRYSDPYGLDVTVCYFPNSAARLGHIGIGVNTTNTRGFYPIETAGFLERFHTEGVVDIDIDRAGEDAPRSCTNIETTPDQDEEILRFIEARQASPGNYNLAGRNCSLFVADALRAGDIPVRKDAGALVIYRSVQLIRRLQLANPEKVRNESKGDPNTVD